MRRGRLSDDPKDVSRAVKLSRIPGVTIAEAAKTIGVSAAAVKRARAGEATAPTRDDLLLAALTKNGTLREGPVGDRAALAGWLDYVNKDGTTADEVGRDLERLARDGHIALGDDGTTFSLVTPWP